MQRMPERSVAGRSFASRRAIEEIVRAAVLGSYGVVGFVDDDPVGRIRRLVGFGGAGVWVQTSPAFTVDLRLTLAFGLPVAEVARQVDSAVRYALRRALDRDPDRLTIHVGGLRFEPSSAPPTSLPADLGDPAMEVGHDHSGRPDGAKTTEPAGR
jgi:uncharacterized alkaline shock family protein YloU